MYILFTSFPDYQALVKMDTGGQRLAARFEVIDWIGTHPFQNLPEHLFTGKVLSEGDQSHFKKRVFRPLIPVALHTVGLKAKHYVGIQFVVGILFVVLLIRFLSKHLTSTASVPVSYTHLDVYKRQQLHFSRRTFSHTSRTHPRLARIGQVNVEFEGCFQNRLMRFYIKRVFFSFIQDFHFLRL